MGRAALFLVFSIPAALCAGWTIFAGKDVNWDLLNYHYYAPFALLAGRLEQDFFAASAQSYLNPVGYLPFYLMVSAGWHSVAVSMALAAAHSLCIGFLYLISWKLLAHRGTRQRILLSCLAAALGGATAVYWATVGTSFLDPLLAVPMLAGLLLLLADDPAYAKKAAYWGARTYDISTLLTDIIGYRVPTGRVEAVVTYHDSCHLKKSMKVAREPREILRAIPGVIFKEMAKPDACCGSGGSYGLTHTETSSAIALRKAADAASTGASTVTTGCPACTMQLLDSTHRFGSTQKVKHYISMLADAVRLDAFGD